MKSSLVTASVQRRLPAGTAMALVAPKRSTTIFVRLLLVAMVLIALILWLVPWQQTSKGDGKVIAFAPKDRIQNISAPIEGRVTRWHVVEGQAVKAGDLIADMNDNDPDILARIGQEKAAVEARIAAIGDRIAAIDTQIDALGKSRTSAVNAAQSRIRMAQQRIKAAMQGLEAADATLVTAELNAARQRELFEKGLSSSRQAELALLEEAKARTEALRAKAQVDSAHAELAAIGADKDRVATDAFSTIDAARAARATATADLAGAQAEKVRLESRLARQSQQALTAPVDGTVLAVLRSGIAGDFVKSGEVLAQIVPATNDRAVEVFIPGVDMPLISVGAKVRLQFEGWPALQFSGWPSVAVGTFGGEVKFIDAAATANQMFRIIVVPDAKGWPHPTYLRQGVRVHAWVQLGVVSLGYELWRQFNGFPPSLPAPSKQTDKDKP